MSVTNDLPPTPSVNPPPVGLQEPLTLPDIQVEPMSHVAPPAGPEPAFPLVKAQRLVSLDVFRGATIAAMLLVNNEGLGKAYAPLEHSDWNGWTPTDLIFPFFLFIVGVAIPFAFSKRSQTESRGQMFGHIWSRALSLFLLGALLAGWPYHPGDLLPAGFTLLKSARIALWVVMGMGFVALLFPWRSRKLSLLLPPIVGVLLLAVGWLVHYANLRALNGGLSASFNFGNGLFHPSHFRIPGVLQRIGICYGIAASIALLAGWRTILLSIIVLFAGYSALMFNAPYHDADPAYNHVVGSLTKEDNFARKIDERVFDRYQRNADGTYAKDAHGDRIFLAQHTYPPYPDNEGLVSTLPAIGSVLIGILIGLFLRRRDRTNVEKCAGLLAQGVFVTVLGVLLSWWLMPINKILWTPSFSVFTAGLGCLVLGAAFWLIDVKGRRAWALPFKIYGMNAIAAYVFSGIIVRFLLMLKMPDPATMGLPLSMQKQITLWTFCQRQVADAVHHAGVWWAHTLPHLPPLDTPGNTSLAFSLAFVIAILLLMSVLYVFKIFLKV
jgi:predicted acyltransferase